MSFMATAVRNGLWGLTRAYMDHREAEESRKVRENFTRTLSTSTSPSEVPDDPPEVIQNDVPTEDLLDLSLEETTISSGKVKTQGRSNRTFDELISMDPGLARKEVSKPPSVPPAVKTQGRSNRTFDELMSMDPGLARKEVSKRPSVPPAVKTQERSNQTINELVSMEPGFVRKEVSNSLPVSSAMKSQRRSSQNINEIMSMEPGSVRKEMTSESSRVLTPASETPSHLDGQLELANQFRLRFEQQNDLSSLDQSIKLYESAIDTTTMGGEKRAQTITQLKEVLHMRLGAIGTLDGVPLSLPTLRSLREQLSATDDLQIPVERGLLRSCLSLYDQQHHLRDLEEARKVATQCFSQIDQQHPLFHSMVALLSRLVSSLLEQYHQSGRLRFLHEATELSYSARSSIHKNHSLRPSIDALVNLVTSYLVPALFIESRDPVPVASGGFGKVYRGQLGQKRVAMKLPHFGHVNEQKMRWFLREIYLWRRVQHPHILPLLGTYEENEELYVISPWMENGNCLTYLRENPNVDRLALIAKALLHLHSHAPVIVHGDIKGENVLINDQGHAILSDFGLSRLHDFDNDQRSMTLTSTELAAAGTARFMAPELFAIEEEDGSNVSEDGLRPWAKTRESDVYAFGCLILQIVTGQEPFSYVRNPVTVIAEVVQGRHPRRPPNFDDSLWEICQMCWKQLPSSRPGMGRILSRLAAVPAST